MMPGAYSFSVFRTCVRMYVLLYECVYQTQVKAFVPGNPVMYFDAHLIWRAYMFLPILGLAETFLQCLVIIGVEQHKRVTSRCLSRNSGISLENYNHITVNGQHFERNA